MTTIAIEGLTVYEQRETAAGVERTTHHCATRRVAQIVAAELELREAGWSVSGLGSSDRPRRPLLLPGERMREPLDGRRSDERAQGLSVRRCPRWIRLADGSIAQETDVLVVDACAGLPPIVLAESGDTAEARRIVEYHLGPLS